MISLTTRGRFRLIEFVNITKNYGEMTGITAITLNLPVAKTTVLIGPSGCGKSTLLRLITGLEQPSGGDIIFFGQSLAQTEITAVRHRLGYVIQEGGLFPHLTVAGNVTLVAQQLGWSAQRIEQRLQVLLDLVQLSASLLARYPGELSGGQRQRVSLMRALMLDPDVLLLDEPLGALDPLIRYELQNDLKALFQRLGKTVLLVTHDMAEAHFFADQIVLMRAGRVVQQGTLTDFVNTPAEDFVKDFIHAQRAVQF